MHDSRVFDHRQIGTQRQFLENAAHAVGARGADAMALDVSSAVADRSRMGRQPAVDDVDDRRFSRPVVTDETDTLTSGNSDRYAVQGLNSTEMYLDVPDLDDGRTLSFNGQNSISQ